MHLNGYERYLVEGKQQELIQEAQIDRDLTKVKRTNLFHYGVVSLLKVLIGVR